MRPYDDRMSWEPGREPQRLAFVFTMCQPCCAAVDDRAFTEAPSLYFNRVGAFGRACVAPAGAGADLDKGVEAEPKGVAVAGDGDRVDGARVGRIGALFDRARGPKGTGIQAHRRYHFLAVLQFELLLNR